MRDVRGPTGLDFPRIELRAFEIEPLQRRGEPVTSGIPWPRGLLTEESTLVLCNHAGQPLPLQTRTLERWLDGSVRWLLLDWQANLAKDRQYWLSIAATPATPGLPTGRLDVVQQEGRVTVDTGAAWFALRPGRHEALVSVQCGASAGLCQTRLTVEDNHGRRHSPCICRLEVEEKGPLRTVIRVEGTIGDAKMDPLLELRTRIHFFAGSPTIRIILTLCNPRKAEHPGGLWDLGNGGSVYIADASLKVTLPADSDDAILHFSAERGIPFQKGELTFEVYQDSSGGDNWRSSSHVNRYHVVPNAFCGYRLRSGAKERTGKRATPVVSLARRDSAIALTMPYFWENFPKAVEASEEGLVLRLFPPQYGDVHELQGGEQKTHEVYVAFGPDSVTGDPLAWARSPLRIAATPEWYCASGVVPYLTPKATDPHSQYLDLVDVAIEGNNTFQQKREVVDEYGWRHFGDIYADHEAVFHKGPAPLVSHYNNQYDAIAGFACQFMRSGDIRWFRHMDELAAHVTDIDIYHTDRDKAAYNHGLFWHTYHYVDADTATHRSYPRAAKVCGGGPANEHNYTTGLMLHYLLTGNRASRDAVLELSRWVVDMDDGKRTVFYHGPGRGAANSIAALMDGHRLSGDRALLTKAEQLIRRCIHPADDIPAKNLLDAENRWFYTMFLQALGRFLDYKAEIGQLDSMYSYARCSLVQYVRWMAEHEYPYLDKPDRLEYPTETWAAQDLRKSEVFTYAARHVTGPTRARFLERAAFFYQYSINTLAGMKTRTLARPLVLLLSLGFMQAWSEQQPLVPAPEPERIEHDFGKPTIFVPQKVKALNRLKVILLALALVSGLGVGWLLVKLLVPQ
jgi:hypothetical protein